MLNRTPRAAAAAATTAFVIASLGLAGCSSGSNTTVIHTPAIQTLGGRDTARGSVQMAVLTANTSNGLALPGGPTPVSIARRILGFANGGRRISATGAATGACTNGIESSQVSNSDGSQTTTTDYFYDAACTTLETEEVIKILSPSTPTNTSGSGTITSYGTTGSVRVVQSLTLSVVTTDASDTPANQETFTLQSSASTAAGGTVTAGVGITCVGTPSSPTFTCSGAQYGTSVGVTSGVAFSLATTGGSSGGNANANVGVAYYAASALAIAETGTTWGISGASAFNSATGTYGYTTTGPSGNGTLTLSDVLYTYVETATLTSTGLSVSIQQNPNSAFNTTTQIATAKIDVGGNGVLTYSDGTTEPIAGGLIGF